MSASSSLSENPWVAASFIFPFRSVIEGSLSRNPTTERLLLHNLTKNALPLPDNRGEDVRTAYRSGELKEEALWLIRWRRRGRAR